MEHMRFIVVGARLAGSYASLLLSRLGHEVLLFDESTQEEKPCGGGVTAKALRAVPWLHENQLPHTEIRTMRMVAADGISADLKLAHPIRIYSRMTLDRSIRQSAERAGTRFLPERCTKAFQQSGSWVVETRKQQYEADFLVGADGANSLVRATITARYAVQDLSLALGFYLPGVYHQDTVITVFQELGFRGYLWSFPRVDHSSVGVLQRLQETNAAELRRRVQEFIVKRYPDAGREMQFYAARIPCLGVDRLLRQRVCGANWGLLGDAAGFVDAITAEGIYFALRSAELFVEAVSKGDPEGYEMSWRRDFGQDLMRAAAWRDRFYCSRFLLRPFTRRAVQATRSSRAVRQLTDRLICGRYTYESMRRQMILRSPWILLEALFNRMRRSP